MYRQGQLDSLCGVYAIINSSKAMCDQHGVRLTRAECRTLFVKVCGVLADDGKLAEALTEGTTIRTFQRMTRAAHDWLENDRGVSFQSRRAFGAAPAGLDDYWSRLLEHWTAFGPGSVLVGMSGQHDHWSCIRSMSERAINLMDSDGIHQLRRDRCTIAGSTRVRTSTLWPTQTLLISA